MVPARSYQRHWSLAGFQMLPNSSGPQNKSSARLPTNLSCHLSALCALVATFIILVFPSFCFAQDENSDPPGTPKVPSTAGNAEGDAVRVTADKSQYDIFNPTPIDQMRPFSTDRPGKSHSSLTVDAGHFQYEGDFWNYTYDHYSTTNQTTRQYIIGAPNLKLGLTNWAELDIATALYNSLEVRSRAGGGISKSSGFGDVFVGGKVNFFGNDGGDQALGAIAFVKIPTAVGGLGNNRAEFFLNVPFTTVLPNRFSLTVEPAVNLLRMYYKQGYQPDYQIIVNLNRPIIGETVTAAIELSLDYPMDHNFGPRHTIDPSLQWLLTPNLQLDVGVYVGITKAAPDFNPYVGISFRY